MAPTTTSLSVMWNQREDLGKPMSTYTLRPGTPLSCDRLYLDNVHIHFVPSASIPPAKFSGGDGPTYEWTAETRELYVRVRPGETHALYANADTQTNPETGSGATQQPLLYSGRLYVTDHKGGSEDDWCRNYKPLRPDDPVAQNWSQVGEITVELLWPTLQADGRAKLSRVPDYRLNKVICDFSLR